MKVKSAYLTALLMAIDEEYDGKMMVEKGGLEMNITGESY